MEQNKPTHPDVPDDIFSEEEETEQRQWQVFLRANKPAYISDVYEALDQSEWTTELGEKGIIPESVELTLVSFYHTGTFREAYVKAAEMCDYLNGEADIPDSSWEFERGSITVIQ